MPYLTKNRFTFHRARDHDRLGGEDLRGARVPDQPADRRRRAHHVQARHHPQPARAAHLRAADRGPPRPRRRAASDRMIARRTILCVALALAACRRRFRCRRAGAGHRSRGPPGPRAKGLRPGGAFDVAITGVAEEEWHVYSVTQGPGGPVPTTIARGPRSALYPQRRDPRPPSRRRAFDPNFEIQTETYEGTFTFVMPGAPGRRRPGQRRHASHRRQLPGLHETACACRRKPSRSRCR